MFVRFRRVPKGGFKPFAAAEGAVSWEWEDRGRERRRQRRWFIRRDEEKLCPYRIKVMLLENRRVAGKVKQEIVVLLGGIDAMWLESFWERMPDPALRHEKWEFYSLRERTAFWKDVLERMSKIGDNHLNKDDRVAARRAIHKVIPWVMEIERKRMELLEARYVFEALKGLHSMTERDIAYNEKRARKIAEELAQLQSQLADQAQNVFHAGMRIAKLN